MTSSALEYQRLRRVQSGDISRAARFVVILQHFQLIARLDKKLVRLP
jgi:hypothetical protein